MASDDTGMPVRGDGGVLPSVSVVIPTRDRRGSLQRTLAALRDDPALSEVIVVDDGSEDDTSAWLRGEARDWPALKPVRTAGIGSTPARAAGVDLARGDVVLFLDDDEIPASGLVSGHARHHSEQEGLIVCGYCPVVLEPHSSVTVRLIARWWEEIVGVVEADPRRGLFHFWSGNFSMRRRDLERVPLAAPDFDGWASHSDREFGLRCHVAGLSYVFDRDLRADHFYRRTLAQFRRDARRSGHGTVLVHRLHQDLLGPVPADLTGSSRRLLTALLTISDHEPFYSLLTGSLGALVRLSDATGMRTNGERASRLLYRVERRRGAREALASFENRVDPGEARHRSALECRPGRER